MGVTAMTLAATSATPVVTHGRIAAFMTTPVIVFETKDNPCPRGKCRRGNSGFNAVSSMDGIDHGRDKFSGS
jgi:hypothetical protein